MLLFEPSCKVQKDRTIMRETDERMAKYSRRGLAVTTAAYLLCFSVGYMSIIAPILAIWLTAGFIIITFARGYILFRFESIYTCAPARWRQMFFIFTLIGGSWWSLILVCFTLTLGFVGETPFLWLYTVIHMATTTHATSPFRKFTRIYQLVSLLPVAIAGVWVGGFEGYMYGLMILVFLGMQEYLTTALNELYWDRLTSNHLLKQKAKNLEAEKRDTEASVDLSSEFLANLGHEFRTSLNDIMGSLSLLGEQENTKQRQSELQAMAAKACERQLDLVNNIADFGRISSRQLVLDHSVLNLRKLLEELLSEATEEADRQNIDLDYRIAQDTPLRIAADGKRIADVVKNLLSHAIQFSEQGNIQLGAHVDRLKDDSGKLIISITDHLTHEQDIDPVTAIERNEAHVTGLWMSICRGLAECMNGTVEVYSDPGKDSCYLVQIPIQLASSQAATLNAHPKLQGKRALIFDPLNSINSGHIEELEAWGIIPELVSTEDAVQERIARSQETEHPFSLLISCPEDEEKAVYWMSSVQGIPQITLVRLAWLKSLEQRQWQEGNYLLPRPIFRKPLHDLLLHSVLGKPLENKQAASRDIKPQHEKQIMLVEDHKVNQMVTEAMLKKLGYQVHLAANGIEALQIQEQADLDLILMDCQMPEMDGYEATRKLREREKLEGTNRTPILAMTAHISESDQSLCFASGMDDYLAKPVRCDDLEAHLMRWLGDAEEQAATV